MAETVVDETEELRATINRLQNALRASKAKTADLVAAVESGARKAQIALGRASHVPAPRPSRSTKKPETALLLLSDWHFGKETSSFGIDVAAKRVRILAEKVAKITEIERADHPVFEIHLLCNGDFVENLCIFPGQAFEVDSTLFQQLFSAGLSLEELIRCMLTVFSRVHVWEQRGNHGRIGKKGESPKTDNIDLLLYRIVRERFSAYESHKRLVWHPAESWYTIVEIGEYRALLIHGDQIRSFGGNIPAFGITRKVNAWATGVLPPFTDVYMGHYHSPLVLPIANGRGRTFVNPSIESDSEYAREFVASTGTPGQRLNFIAGGRVSSERIIWLD